jgi:hypothetical protein
MTRSIRRAAIASLALSVLAGGLSAQPLMLPGAQLPGGGPASQEPAAPPAPARLSTTPVAAKAVGDESVLNRELRLNGSVGGLRVERSGRSELRARVALQGSRISRPAESCTVRLEEPVTVASRGRPEGLLRYEFQVPVCPIAAEVLDGALWVRGVEACTFEASDCRVDVNGLWGPEPGALTADAKAIERARAEADRAVRENYKALTQRAAPQSVRAIVSEQAAFSSEREMLCRTYAREASHGFCNARFTEARAAQLAARLGVAPAVQQARPEGQAAPAAPRRRPAPIMPPPSSLLPSRE